MLYFFVTANRHEMWLVMKLYELGSLQQYLQNNTISRDQMMNMFQTVAEALEYLHCPVKTTHGPIHCGLAHRDLHPGNILLADRNGTCVLGDFGLSVIGTDILEKKKKEIKVGVKRYRAPEVLNGHMNTNELLSFCMTDIYAYGLVMWVVMRRVEIEGQCFFFKVGPIL